MTDVKSATLRIVMVAALFAGLGVMAPSLAQEFDAAPGPKPPPAKDDTDISLLDLIVKGGPVMIPIGICSVLALAFAIERLISLKREKVIPEAFIRGLREVFVGSGDVDPGMEYCEAHPSPLSNIFKAGINRLPQGAEAMEKAIEDAGGREVAKMKRSLRPLSVIATVSPLLGLLGTVYGLISAFQAATAGGIDSRATTLGKGIYEALVTTAAGLTLAIPVLIVYALFTTKIDVLVDHMDAEALQFIEHAAYGKPLPAAAVTAANPEPPASSDQGPVEDL